MTTLDKFTQIQVPLNQVQNLDKYIKKQDPQEQLNQRLQTLDQQPDPKLYASYKQKTDNPELADNKFMDNRRKEFIKVNRERIGINNNIMGNYVKSQWYQDMLKRNKERRENLQKQQSYKFKPMPTSNNNKFKDLVKPLGGDGGIWHNPFPQQNQKLGK